MKTDIQTLKDSFWMGYESYYDSRVEADQVWDMYHNRQWTSDQLAKLESRGQPKETFNVIKLFARMLVGYYSTVVNNVRAIPTNDRSSVEVALVTDSIHSVFERNHLDVEGDKIKLSGMISGLMCALVEPFYTGERDEFGRPLYDIRISHVPDYEVVLDPMSTDENYEDARFLHRFKWVTEETVEKTWGQAKLDELVSYHNHLEIEEAEYEYSKGDQFQGRYKVFDNYLVVHSVIEDDNGKRYSIFWSGDVELQRDEITFRDVKWGYRVVKLHTSNKNEYYGIFREIVETQKAINQALIKLQLMINTQKVFIETTAIDNIQRFTDAVNRVNGVIPLKKLSGLKVENLSREALEQYEIIDRALDRIQRLLSVNDSFLGMAYASDSGRKVKLQQNATVMALRYLTVRIEAFYEALGRDVAFLIKQFFTANQVMRVGDELNGERFIELNKPMQIFTGEIGPDGKPVMEYAFEQIFNPDTGEPEETEDGALVFAPIPEDGTEISITSFDIQIDSVAYNDEDERAQLMVENVLAGNIGQMMAQVNPAGFFAISGLTLRTMKTKYSAEISKVFEETSQMLGNDPQANQVAQMMAGNLQNQGGAKSSELKLPQNTNEEGME